MESYHDKHIKRLFKRDHREGGVTGQKGGFEKWQRKVLGFLSIISEAAWP